MEIRTTVIQHQGDAVDTLLNIAGNIGFTGAGFATLGVGSLVIAADMAIEKNPALELRFNAEARDTGVEPNSGTGLVFKAIAYARYMEECRKMGVCPCGDPTCRPETSSESSTSRH